jgi:hypothetical protein
MKTIALVLGFATPAVLAGTINMACPPGDQVVVHTVTNNGDFNGDGVIDSEDLQTMKAHFGQPTNPENDSVLTDLNGDGTTDLTDYSLLRMLARNHN